MDFDVLQIVPSDVLYRCILMCFFLLLMRMEGCFANTFLVETGSTIWIWNLTSNFIDVGHWLEGYWPKFLHLVNLEIKWVNRSTTVVEMPSRTLKLIFINSTESTSNLGCDSLIYKQRIHIKLGH